MSVIDQALCIVSKLRGLKCSVIEGHPDGWVLQMMFKSYPERYQMIEWILSELKFNILDVSKNQNSFLRKAENLLATLSALGILKDNEMNIIEGSASEKEQLRIWKFLVNALVKKYEYGNQKCVSDEYNRSCSYIHSLCQNVNLKALFEKKVQLFPSQVLKDSKEELEKIRNPYKPLNEVESLREDVLRSNASRSMEIRPVDLSGSICDLDHNVSKMQASIDNEKLGAVEAGIEEVLSKFQDTVHTEFVESYAKLKPYLSNIPEGDLDDVGPSFKTAQEHLESVTKLNKSVSLLKVTEKELKALNQSLQKFCISTEPLSDSLLGESISTLQTN